MNLIPLNKIYDLFFQFQFTYYQAKKYMISVERTFFEAVNMLITDLILNH